MNYDKIYDKKIAELLEKITETSSEKKSAYQSYGTEAKEIILNKIESYGINYHTVFENIQHDIDRKHAEGKDEDAQEYVFFKYCASNNEPYQRNSYFDESDTKLRVLICGNKTGYNKALFEYVHKNVSDVTPLGYLFNGDEIKIISETFRPHIIIITVTLNDALNCTIIKEITKLLPNTRIIAVLGSDMMQGQVTRAGACQVFSRYDSFSVILDFIYDTCKKADFKTCVQPVNTNLIADGNFSIKDHNTLPQNPLNKFIGWFCKYILH